MEFSGKVDPVPDPAGEVLRRILAQVPTLFGRLVYVSNLRDSAGAYSHPTLNQLVGSSEADRTLCHCHHRLFGEWIGCSLAEQKTDLDRFLAAPSSPPVDLLFCRALIPQSAHEVERLLYLTDLETLLELLRLERGGAFADPEA